MSAAEPQAGRPRRLFAAGFDFALTAIVAFAAMWPLGVFEHEQAYERIQFVTRLFALALGGFVLVNGWLLHNYGQTVGKKLLRIRAVGAVNGQPLGLWKSVIRVFWVFALAAIVAVYLRPVAALSFLGLLIAVDALFIFTPRRRCLHDYVAGSKVQKVAEDGAA